MDAELIAGLLANAVEALLPAHVRLDVCGAAILMRADDRLYAPGCEVLLSIRDLLDMSDSGAETPLELAGLRFLDVLQDYVAETTGEPWPAVAGSAMPHPQSQRQGDVVQLAYVSDEGRRWPLEQILFFEL